MEEKTYSLTIKEISDGGRIDGVDYVIITQAQYEDIIAIASVIGEDYEPMNLREKFFKE